jgi:hypothetical protein
MRNLFAAFALMAAAGPAWAAEVLVPLTDSSIYFSPALGKQVNVRFSEGFTAAHLPKADYDRLIISELPEGQVCFFGEEQGIKAQDPKLADVSRTEQSDICVARADAFIRYVPQDVEGAPKVPFYATDKEKCAWKWVKGKDVGVWAETCSFESGTWSVAYDEKNDYFTLNVIGSDPFPVLRQFKKKPNETPDALLPLFRERGLIPNDTECIFAPADSDERPPGWELFEIVPIGKRKDLFDAQPQDEVPEPPCGDIGYAVDYVGFFMVPGAHKDRVYHVDLGQDGTMFDPFTITPF